MFRPIIFISHSTKTSEAMRYRKALENAFDQDQRFRYWVDEHEIQTSDMWRRKIHDGLWRAHGCVLVLTPEAVGSSDFVQLEAAVLSSRALCQARFPVVIVVTEQALLEDLRRGVFGEMQLTEWQMVVGKPPEVAAGEVLATLARAFSDGLVQDAPWQRLVREAAEALAGLARLTIDDVEAILREVLPAASSHEAVPLSAMPRGFTNPLDAERYAAAAEALLRADLVTSSEVLKRFAAKLKARLTHPERRDAREALLRLLHLSAPLWIDEATGQELGARALCRDANSRQVYVMARETEMSVRALVARAVVDAFDLELGVCHLEPPTAENRSVADQIIDYMLDSYAEFARRTRGVAAPRLLLLQEALEEAETPIFVIVPPELARDAKLIDRSEIFHPMLLRIAGTVDAVVRTECPCLALPPDAEREAWEAFWKAVVVIQNAIRAP